MEKRFFPRIGKEVSLLGFGCMRLPLLEPPKQDIDYPLAEAMIDKAVAMGVNYFDTAWAYHDEKSEAFIGHALRKYPRESVYLANKLPIWLVQSPEDVDRLFLEQLDRCQVSYFDFYLIHALDNERYGIHERHGVYEALRRKKEQGCIKHLGFSFHATAGLLETIVTDHQWDFVQIQLNYVDWDMCDAKSLYGILAERNIPVVVMEPVRGGALATLNDKAVDILKTADPEASTASWAIRYAASLPNVMTVLSGMSTMEQVEDNLKTMADFHPLAASEYAVIEKAAAAYRESGAIPCTACRYCMDCPSGVDIPRVFAVYNHYCVNKRWIQFNNNYKALQEEEQAHNCVACNVCVEQCPQKIDIPGQMRMIVEFVDKKGKI
ncbi:Oxidoreductase, aldo/keto reductase family [uncultured delta proteobacterium]|uniref:Oxidoreductase, aldo/keto reductase family n=1 Tax=uncultured delta proteobacterium TaxID=34034 RepID=A0A212ITS9_9DELT|nr:Oxidoreductase, aldo/keto reductase family [uncultured delta proteobacterium]